MYHMNCEHKCTWYSTKKNSVFVSFWKLCEWSDWELNGSFPLSYKIERLLGVITASSRNIGFVRDFFID